MGFHHLPRARVPSWTSESTAEPEAQTPSTPFFFSLFQTVLLPLIFFPGASLCIAFSLPELLAGHPVGALPWTFWACPVSFVAPPHRTRHNVSQGHCVQLCGVCPDRGTYREARARAEFSLSPRTEARCLGSRRHLLALPPAERYEGALFSYSHKGTLTYAGEGPVPVTQRVLSKCLLND